MNLFRASNLKSGSLLPASPWVGCIGTLEQTAQTDAHTTTARIAATRNLNFGNFGRANLQWNDVCHVTCMNLSKRS